MASNGVNKDAISSKSLIHGFSFPATPILMYTMTTLNCLIIRIIKIVKYNSNLIVNFIVISMI